VERIDSWSNASKSTASRMAAGLPVSVRCRTARGQAMVTSRCPLRIGRTPWTEPNPGRGCGMKQAREVGSGENRRGVEKTRGRSEVGKWTSPRVRVRTRDRGRRR
jgi:hypothetical protein